MPDQIPVHHYITTFPGVVSARADNHIHFPQSINQSMNQAIKQAIKQSIKLRKNSSNPDTMTTYGYFTKHLPRAAISV